MVIKEKVDLEYVLSKFNLSSPYYLKFFSLIIFAGVTNAFYSVNYVFAASSVRYRCEYPECGTQNIFDEPFLNLPIGDVQCSRYPVLVDNGTCFYSQGDVSNVTQCSSWIYEEPRSFVEEMNLACEDWKRTLVGSVHSFGYMIGLLFSGPLADKLGRKTLIIFMSITAASMGLARSFTTSYWLYLAFELIEAMFGDKYSPTYMLGVEMVTKENRVTFVTIMTASVSLAGMMLAVLAWSLPYWRHFLRAIYAPSLLFIFYVLFLDESVRWLLIKGRKDEAKDILKKAAKINKVDINEDALSIQCDMAASNSNLISLLKMTFSSKKILLRFLTCVCMWITGLFNKYALLINSVELEGNKYLNFGLAAFTELPASLALAFTLKRFKRKITLMLSFLLTGMFCIGQSLVPKGNPWLSTLLFLIGKFMSTISYATVYLYTSELFPTYTRNTMHALCSSLGRISTILAPQTPLLMRYWTGLPSVLVGSMSLFTGLIVILMPETSEEVLPDTVLEAEEIGSRPTVSEPINVCTKL